MLNTVKAQLLLLLTLRSTKKTIAKEVGVSHPTVATVLESGKKTPAEETYQLEAPYVHSTQPHVRTHCSNKS